MLSPQVGVRVSGFSLSCRRRSMCRSGGREVVSSSLSRRRSMCRSGGSGGKYLLPHHAAGGACVTPGPREVVIFFPITPPEEHVSLRGVGR